jgi:hypothetical protein
MRCVLRTPFGEGGRPGREEDLRDVAGVDGCFARGERGAVDRTGEAIAESAAREDRDRTMVRGERGQGAREGSFCLDADERGLHLVADAPELGEVGADERVRRRYGDERDAREEAAEHEERVIDARAGEREDRAARVIRAKEEARDAFRGRERLAPCHMPDGVAFTLEEEVAIRRALGATTEEGAEGWRRIAKAQRRGEQPCVTAALDEDFARGQGDRHVFGGASRRSWRKCHAWRKSCLSAALSASRTLPMKRPGSATNVALA